MLNRLKAAISALFMGLFLVAPVLAQPAPEDPKVAAPAIWTIEKPGGGTITLFGTVHVLPPETKWRSADFDAAFSKADVVVLEVNFSRVDPSGLAQYMARNSLNPPGVTLSTLLTPEEKETVRTAAMSIGTPFETLEPLRPWFAGLQLTVAFALKQGFDPNSGVDRILEAEASKAGKVLDQFETAADQLGIFVNLTPEQEKAFLVLGSRDILQEPEALHELVRAWATGDQAVIDAIMNGAFEELPELADLLLTKRNERWVERITSAFMNDTNNYMIAVGAGHLAGDHGVPAMLRAKGITVQGP